MCEHPGIDWSITTMQMRRVTLVCVCFTVVPGEHHYYLNLDRCAHGGQLKLSAEVTGIYNNKQVCGPKIFAVNQNCTAVYYHVDPPRPGWFRYTSLDDPEFKKHLNCKPKEEFH